MKPFFTNIIKKIFILSYGITYSLIGFSQNVPTVGLNIGNKAPELIFWNTDSTQQIALSSLQGKIVLVDFWASWCGPCRMENPNLVNAYKKYKNGKFPAANGFDIYSVSLDKNKTGWINAIKNDKLEWTSHVSDLKGWYSEAAKTYSIYSIPNNFLLDENGIIVAKGLRGQKLHDALDSLLNINYGPDDSIWTASPNPFNTSTNITLYNLASDTVTLKIYNRWGNSVAVFYTDTILTGTITVTFNADTLPDDVYIAFLKKNDETYAKQLAKSINAAIPYFLPNTELQLEIYPNPFSSSLTIEFNSSPTLGGQGRVSFSLYNSTGKEISRIQKNHLSKGTHHEQINTEQFTPGIYFLKTYINSQTQTMKTIKL